MVEPGGTWKANPYFAFTYGIQPLLTCVAVAVGVSVGVSVGVGVEVCVAGTIVPVGIGVDVPVETAVVEVGVAVATGVPAAVMSTQDGRSKPVPMPNSVPEAFLSCQ